jgi:hypothetical protein
MKIEGIVVTQDSAKTGVYHIQQAAALIERSSGKDGMGGKAGQHGLGDITDKADDAILLAKYP